MTTKSKPYVGVCCVASPDEARKVTALFRDTGFTMQTGHQPMVGVQLSWKHLDFGFSEGNLRSPRFDAVPSILESIQGDVFATVHYYTTRAESIVSEISKIMDNCEVYDRDMIGGLQINHIFPKPDQVRELKNRYPKLKIILQISPSPDTITELAENMASKYANVDYLILDPSHGKGVDLNLEEVLAAFRILRKSGVQSEVVFSGGFNGSNVRERVSKIADSLGYMDFSIDAEGGLRDRLGDGFGNDVLNLDKVRSYLRGASEAFLQLKNTK